MRMLLVLPLAASLAACALTGGPVSAAESVDYAAALNDAQRPAEERASDANRKPAELLAFAQIAPGEKVGDYIMGGGYWTRILSNLVGPSGKVYAVQPDEFIGFNAAYATQQDAAVAGRANVVPLRGSVSAPPFPEQLDTIITVQNLHDTFNTPGVAPQAISALFAALKPGGILVVVDHRAPDDAGASLTSSAHRISRQTAVDALSAAGFLLDGESNLYAQPADPRTESVFSPAIRGKTDQFALRMRKPL